MSGANADNVLSKGPRGKDCYIKEYFAVLVRSGLVRIMYPMPNCYFISIVLYECLIFFLKRTSLDTNSN